MISDNQKLKIHFYNILRRSQTLLKLPAMNSSIKEKIFSFLIVSITLASPDLAENSTEISRATQHMQNAAKTFNLTPQNISSEDKSSILGQWYLEGVADKSCVNDFFAEFNADGSVNDNLGNALHYQLKEKFIEVTLKDEAKLYLFKLSGNYYLPSFECLLSRLVRGPKFNLKDKKNLELEFDGCKQDSDCLLVQSGTSSICMLTKFAKNMLGVKADLNRCKCITNESFSVCSPK